MGFDVGPPRPIRLGPWRRYGCPFYDREVSYAFELLQVEGRGAIVLAAEDWGGSVILIQQEGQTVTQLQEPPYRVVLDASGGRNVMVRIVGLPKNLLGPWHDPEHPRGRAWIPMWFGPNIPDEPQSGERYDLLDLGLFTAPRWAALE